MELTRVDETLTAFSTLMVDPSSHRDPMYVVNIKLQRKCEIRLRVAGGGGEEILLDSYPITPESGCLFQIPIEVVGLPALFIPYVAHKISGFNLAASFCDNLASKIASFAYGLIGRCRGFHVSAHVDLVDVDVHEVAPEEIRAIFDSEGATVPRGASETVLKKLKKERFYLKQGNGDSSSGSGYARETEKNGAIIKGVFVFGSSLVDNGNNNVLKNSIAQADFLPYGIDFPYGPYGRFTNGKNVIDLLCDQLKLPLVPAFNDPSTKGSQMIHGVNYASVLRHTWMTSVYRNTHKINK
ncbi:unnamed protein product [Dovyalis caffra]|uniref:Uncharacterized protein n=1 Tax=Dovyalis caffra TaxID=77055 RepID=A0AAV1QPD4_9ROSI|nr:unnamed protein product [Dovyalis caffra]